jgi:hypothetical protein
MPAAPVITDDIKMHIADIYQSNPTQPAKQVLIKLHKILGREDWPKLSVIQRELKKIRDKEKELEEYQYIRSIWSLGSLKERPGEVPVEALPYIFEIQKLVRSYLADTLWYKNGLPFLFVRWVGRLYPIIKEIKTLLLVSVVYSNLEYSCGLAGIPMDTREFDEQLLDNNYTFFYSYLKDSEFERLF